MVTSPPNDSGLVAQVRGVPNSYFYEHTTNSVMNRGLGTGLPQAYPGKGGDIPMVPPPETSPIGPEQLIAEVKGIYAGLFMVERSAGRLMLNRQLFVKPAFSPSWKMCNGKLLLRYIGLSYMNIMTSSWLRGTPMRALL